MCGIGCCVWVTEIPKDEIEEICNSIRNRGPDSFGEYTIEDSNVHFAASVLRMRGSDVTPQPLISPSGDVFAWNGEVFGGLYVIIIYTSYNRLRMVRMIHKLCLSQFVMVQMYLV